VLVLVVVVVVVVVIFIISEPIRFYDGLDQMDGMIPSTISLSSGQANHPSSTASCPNPVTQGPNLFSDWGSYAGFNHATDAFIHGLLYPLAIDALGVYAVECRQILGVVDTVLRRSEHTSLEPWCHGLRLRCRFSEFNQLRDLHPVGHVSGHLVWTWHLNYSPTSCRAARGRLLL
jgi:hypothetical protein